MTRKTYTAKSVSASGPYSHAVDAGEFVFFSGQTAMNTLDAPDWTGDIKVQTKQCFTNLFAVMSEAGISPDEVVKVNVYLTTMDDFDGMNEVYKAQFSAPYPARTCVAVSELPLGAEVEIEIIARRAK